MSWQWQDALVELMNKTGLSWSDVVLPEVEAFTVQTTTEQWIERDFTVQRARIEEQIAGLENERLPANAARFDRILAETELDRQRLAARRAVDSSRRIYEAIIRRITSQAEIISIRKEELQLNDKLFQEAEQSYSHGMMDAKERDRTGIRVLNARMNLIRAQLEYLKTIMEYAVVAELSPSEVQ